jgi:hypothetical protein
MTVIKNLGRHIFVLRLLSSRRSCFTVSVDRQVHILLKIHRFSRRSLNIFDCQSTGQTPRYRPGSHVCRARVTSYFRVNKSHPKTLSKLICSPAHKDNFMEKPLKLCKIYLHSNRLSGNFTKTP